MTKKNKTDKNTDWLDKPENVTKIIGALFVVCLGLGVLDFTYHKHPYFSWEEIPNFYGFFGFFGCVVLVVAAKVMRIFLKRDEDYYDK